MALFFIIFFTVYTAFNSYVFIRGWQVISTYPILKPMYTVLFIIIAYGYVLAKVLYKYLFHLTYDILLGIGEIWFAFLVYFILSLLFIEIRNVEITIPKGESRLNELNIVMASDIHLSPIDGERLLSRIVDKMNSLNPDIILLAGDIVDDKAEVLETQKIGESFRRLKSRYGVYSINGNHEFINEVESCVRYAENFGIKFLRDKSELIDSSFYVIGREDSAMPQFTGKQRKNLEEIVKDLSDKYPKILLDHTPFKLEQAQQNNIDLQLSGHTHHGQIWPANLITKMIYEVSWGYKKKGNTHYYVSSGAGTWGPPVRTGSSSEIVNIKVKFI